MESIGTAPPYSATGIAMATGIAVPRRMIASAKCYSEVGSKWSRIIHWAVLRPRWTPTSPELR